MRGESLADEDTKPGEPGGMAPATTPTAPPNTPHKPNVSPAPAG
jgi:hypothetical protein